MGLRDLFQKKSPHKSLNSVKKVTTRDILLTTTPEGQEISIRFTATRKRGGLWFFNEEIKSPVYTDELTNTRELFRQTIAKHTDRSINYPTTLENVLLVLRDMEQKMTGQHKPEPDSNSHFMAVWKLLPRVVADALDTASQHNTPQQKQKPDFPAL